MDKYRINYYVDAIAHIDEQYDSGHIDAEEWRERVAAVIALIEKEVLE